jgi:hypothetical protein
MRERNHDDAANGGPRGRGDLEQNAAAVGVTLSDASLARLAAVSASGIAEGMRYPETQMKRLGL